MNTWSRVRSWSVISFLAVGGLAATQVASAGPPNDHLADLGLRALVPDCVAGAPNTGGAHRCEVRPFAQPSWQADPGEWIVIVTAFGAPDQAACPAAAAVVATYTVDSDVLPTVQAPCSLAADVNVWVVDNRALSHPLPPGDHLITATFYFPLELFDIPAGTTFSFSTTLTVVPGG